MFRLSTTVRNLLIINLVIFGIDWLLESRGVDITRFLGLYYFKSEYFQPYQFLTYMFLHGNFMHIFSNMFALIIFGPALEEYFGSKRFVSFYLICGVGAGLFYSATQFIERRPLENAAEAFIESPTQENYSKFILKVEDLNLGLRMRNYEEALDKSPDSFTINSAKDQVKEVMRLLSSIPMVGASGAVFGILMAFGMLFPNTVLVLLFPPIPIKAKYFVGLYAIAELYAGVQRVPGDNIAHFAHIGGMVIAFILLRIWQKNQYRR